MYFRSTDDLDDFDQNCATPESSIIKNQLLDLKTLHVFSPLKRGVNNWFMKQNLTYSSLTYLPIFKEYSVKFETKKGLTK